jgi:hypothetical protein
VIVEAGKIDVVVIWRTVVCVAGCSVDVTWGNVLVSVRAGSVEVREIVSE